MVIDGIIQHYSMPGYQPFSVPELLTSYGRKWLKDYRQAERFKELFAICRDGIIRPRKLRVAGSSLVIDTSIYSGNTEFLRGEHD